MFNLPLSLILKLGGFVLVLVIIGFHFASDHKTQEDLAEAQKQLVLTQQDLSIANKNLMLATKSAEKYTQAAEASVIDRNAIKSQLQVTLKKLKAQKPPAECKAAIDWAIDYKLDMNWDKKKNESKCGGGVGGGLC